MEAMEIIKRIDRLPANQKIWIAERIIHSIREKEEDTVLAQAADLLYNDYKNDISMTEFTSLDCEDFYEAR
jgi:hypothetical protein